jgi:cytochrome b6-f complex iron-sulfur subunit
MQSGNSPHLLLMTGERLSRRKALTRIAGAVVAGSTLPWLAGCNDAAKPVAPLPRLYPGLNGQFGDLLQVGVKVDFPAATPDKFKLNVAGVFYQQLAKTYLVHLAKETSYLFTGITLENQLAIEVFARDPDGSYWLALYQRCVHLGTTVAFRDDCLRFKCPSHGAVYHCDGEYLTGPAPRSMDRFPLLFEDENVLVDTSKIITSVGHPTDSLRLLPVPLVACL